MHTIQHAYKKHAYAYNIHTIQHNYEYNIHTIQHYQEIKK